MNKSAKKFKFVVPSADTVSPEQNSVFITQYEGRAISIGKGLTFVDKTTLGEELPDCGHIFNLIAKSRGGLYTNPAVDLVKINNGIKVEYPSIYDGFMDETVRGLIDVQMNQHSKNIGRRARVYVDVSRGTNPPELFIDGVYESGPIPLFAYSKSIAAAIHTCLALNAPDKKLVVIDDPLVFVKGVSLELLSVFTHLLWVIRKLKKQVVWVSSDPKTYAEVRQLVAGEGYQESLLN